MCELWVPDMKHDFLGIKRPGGIPLDFTDSDADAEAATADHVCRKILTDSSADWGSACLGNCVEALWNMWCTDAENYLYQRAFVSGAKPNMKNCKGRGHVKLQRQTAATPQMPQGGARTQRLSKLGKLNRRTVDLLRQVVLHGTGAVVQ